MKKRCLLHGIPCIDVAISNKLKDKIGPNKSKANNDIDIKPVNAKHFFWMAYQKDHKGYIWISQVFSRNCISKNYTDNNHMAK